MTATILSDSVYKKIIVDSEAEPENKEYSVDLFVQIVKSVSRPLAELMKAKYGDSQYRMIIQICDDLPNAGLDAYFQCSDAWNKNTVNDIDMEVLSNVAKVKLIRRTKSKFVDDQFADDMAVYVGERLWYLLRMKVYARLY